MRNIRIPQVFTLILKAGGLAHNPLNKKTPDFTFLGCKIGCLICKTLIFNVCCGETGIRTPGTSQYNGFQDRRNRPLCHLSKTLLQECFLSKAMQRYILFFNLQIFNNIFLSLYYTYLFL